MAIKTSPTTNAVVVVLLMIQAGICVGKVAADESPLKGKLIEARFVHLRNRGEREWSSFPEAIDGSQLTVSFDAAKNPRENCLLLRQQDVKQQWFVTLNGKRLGELTRDENDMTICLVIPPETLKDGVNLLVIESSTSAKSTVDDIRVGLIRWHSRPLGEVLSEATLEVNVVSKETHEPIPCRITVVDADQSLVSFGTASGNELAVRPGVVFTSTGRASLKLPAGKYTVFAGRGFEYSIRKTEVTVAAGETQRAELWVQREVATPGYVACDTHIHTLTHSGHGDATIEERMITLAAEGVELPIATDHNVHIDYDPIARKLGVRKYFTPVMGNEVTTPRGHFNIFPVAAGARVPDHKQTDWGLLFDDIYRTPGVKVAILNHARDLHSNVRPFGPALHNAVVGENLEGWPLRFNGMEVINSGATQTDVLQLFRDWMGLLNHGYQVTPVGSSDSHDVARYFAGQGRTYIRCDDSDPGNLDVDAAVTSFVQGKVMVSYGLLTELTVKKKFASGDLVAVGDAMLPIEVRVLGPQWVHANRVLLFANGKQIQAHDISSKIIDDLPLGVKWKGSWIIPRPHHDVHLVAIALGPGLQVPFWPTAKPYQPTSPSDATHVIGCSGAIWLDADGDGMRTCARDYAERLMAKNRDDMNKLISDLADYDEAIAAQAAHLLRLSGVSLQSEQVQTALKEAAPVVQAGFQQYIDAWRENVIARTTP